MTDEQSFFDEPVKNDMRTCNNIWQITASQWDNYTTDCLLDYPYFIENYRLIAIELSKHQAL